MDARIVLDHLRAFSFSGKRGGCSLNCAEIIRETRAEGLYGAGRKDSPKREKAADHGEVYLTERGCDSPLPHTFGN